MKNGKTPGNDGLPVKFYKVFWPQISELFIKTIRGGS